MWSEIVVGDLIKVTKDEQFPCDLIFLKSSSKNGIAFVDTMNLDGEVFLKIFYNLSQKDELERENGDERNSKFRRSYYLLDRRCYRMRSS